jgi:FkbM family methyltransferase
MVDIGMRIDSSPATGDRGSSRLAQWAQEVRTYWRQSRTVRDFIAIMRVRLSQSKVGRWVTPEPIVIDVDLVSLGPGVRLRSHTTDISVLGEFVRGDGIYYMPPDAHAETVIDLGANIGLAYRWLRARYPSARFVCVEPDPGNLEILRANVRAVDGMCEIVPACIGGRARRATLESGNGEWAYRMADVDDPSDGDVEVVTMDQLLVRTGVEYVSILKCDIEGAEAELFAECDSWIDRVDYMVVECHTDAMTTELLMQALARSGARLELLNVERNPRFGYEIATLRRAPAARPSGVAGPAGSR